MLPAGLVASLRYKPGWTFKVAGPLGSMLCIYATTLDSLNPTQERITQHQFTIPDFELDGRTPIRWVFDCLLLCELHEAGEFFQVADERPFFPHHQDEGSPYELVDRSEPRCP